MPALGNILRVSGVHFHSYGKEPRPNRKLGHCTINAPSPAARDRALQQLLKTQGGLIASGVRSFEYRRAMSVNLPRALERPLLT